MDGLKRLPDEFLERMERFLGTEYEEFLASYDRERYYGLRRNPFKATEEEFMRRMPFALEKVSWAAEGYYYPADEQPGRHVLHEAGAYYIQEPSAMAVVEILDPQPGESILDLCAAPGGKSTQIAGKMRGEGLLVSNEVIPNRAKVLSQNVERMGVRNCVACNETPERMVGFFPAFFDRVLVDAPCSGEGMFRKDDTAVSEWSVEHVSMCADRQYGILEEAAKMLKCGGALVYSTCTFSPVENEGVISRFIREHGEFEIEAVSHDPAFVPGRPEWVCEPVQGIENTMRLMPHRLKGEGHYIARLRKKGVHTAGTQPCAKGRRERKKEEIVTGRVEGFLTGELGLLKDWLKRQGGALQMFGEQIYLVPEAMPPMEGIKVVRPGLHIGAVRKNRLEPTHALAHALHIDEIEDRERVMELTKEQAERYLHGEGLPCTVRNGWTLLTYEGYPLGFGKAVNGQMKNHYPKGLRR